jgi:hypothetical protein
MGAAFSSQTGEILSYKTRRFDLRPNVLHLQWHVHAYQGRVRFSRLPRTSRAMFTSSTI